MNIQKFKFDDVEIEFDLRQGKNVMVNATEMAKIFGKEVARFMENDSTNNFIEACLKTRNSSFLGVKNREDLVVSRQKSGTWMHRVLALKFAAWLSPDFEVWVWMTIDHLIFGFAIEIQDSISETVMLKRKQNDLKNKLAKRDPDFKEYLDIEYQLIDAKTRRSNATKNKFRETAEDLFSSQRNEGN